MDKQVATFGSAKVVLLVLTHLAKQSENEDEHV